MAGRCFDQDLSQPVGRARCFGQTHDQCEPSTALDDLGDLLALDEALQRGQNLWCRYAVPGSRRIVDPHLDLRREHLLLDLQIGESRDGGKPRT